MSDFIKEKYFEEDIEKYLLAHGGYAKGDPKAFDKELALDTATFLTFIKTSQPKKWEKYSKLHGAKSETLLIQRFVHQVKEFGLLKILRNGFAAVPVSNFRAAFWKPETGINEESVACYEANILHCTRQLRYSLKNQNSVDIVLFLNGIPVVSMELKCPFTGQTTEDAVRQYKFDRSGKDPIFAFNQRVLVHFAVDFNEVKMATKLEGEKTFFLPFNQGSNGAGKVGTAGNPNNLDGYATDYLWKQILPKDRLLEIIQRYLHLQVIKDKSGKPIDERIIFPRYHQLDVVTKLLADVKAHGAGHNYLIQHSAGSGKSNSIAWLAHRLSNLHDANDQKIFKSVIVVTDRKVLDSQLQDTIFQFDHVPGVVQNIDKNSRQLKDALEDSIPIIVTTLQKFPFIYREIHSSNKRFAIIVDEAHSSQTGESANKLKRALADTEQALEEYAQLEGEEELKTKDAEERLLDELAAQGFHKNLSFFAFTATPKHKTLEMFGTKGKDEKFYPFHIYSMKQAIAEGFILDVLRNYMTYKTYYKIAKTIADNPEMDTANGIKAIRNYETLHPHNIAQKTAVMLEHFSKITKNEIGGRAKAMVVTASRLHAIRYYFEFKRQISIYEEYKDIDVLVAFSGEVKDTDGFTYTEAMMNRNKLGEYIKEEALPEEFHSGDFNILIVAEKYQTGFDEPLLHTMFVDKSLSGVKAVQTLSRLNRTTKGKNSTFVLDFVNDSETIRKSFEPFYEESFLEDVSDPNALFDMKSRLEGYGVFYLKEINEFAEIFYSDDKGDRKQDDESAIAMLLIQLKPAFERFINLPSEQRREFRGTLARFTRIYSFLTQVYRMFDRELHKFYLYAKFLLKILPGDEVQNVSVSDKIELEYYRIEKQFEGSITLEEGKGGIAGIAGSAGAGERTTDTLEELIQKINERHGTEFTEMDKLFLQVHNDYVRDEKWKGYANSTDESAFLDLFLKDFLTILITRLSQNKEFGDVLMNDADLVTQIGKNMGRSLFRELREE